MCICINIWIAFLRISEILRLNLWILQNTFNCNTISKLAPITRNAICDLHSFWNRSELTIGNTYICTYICVNVSQWHAETRAKFATLISTLHVSVRGFLLKNFQSSLLLSLHFQPKRKPQEIPLKYVHTIFMQAKKEKERILI